jgi:Secretion system C-terminal sorting domain
MKKITLIVLMALGFGNSMNAQVWDWVFAPVPTGEDAYGLDIIADTDDNVYFNCTSRAENITFGSQSFVGPNNGGYVRNYVAKFDENENMSWVKASEQDEVVVTISMLTDGAGNVYSVGNYDGDMSIGNMTLPGTTSYPSDLTRTFITKTDSNGNLIWAKYVYSAGGDNYYMQAMDIALDASGNIFISGHMEGATLNFDSVIMEAGGPIDTFLAKYDNNGNIQWARNGAGDAWLASNCELTCDSSGNVYMIGNFDTSITFGDTMLVNEGYKSSYVVKYAPNGDFQWAKKLGTTGASYVTYSSIIATDGTNVYVVGYFENASMTFDNITLTNPSPGQASGFIAKFNANGTIQWARIPGQSISDLYMLPDGSSYITGSFGGTQTIGGTTLTNEGIVNAFVAKMDADGSFVWAKQIGGTGAVRGNKITVNDNTLYATGSFDTTVRVDDQILTTFFGNTFLAKLSLVPLSNEEFQQNSLSIFPNPAQNILNINNELAVGQAYNITDMTGRTIKSGIAESAIDVSSLSSGLYNLTITNASVKFVKE